MSKKDTIILFVLLFLVLFSLSVPSILWFKAYYINFESSIDSNKLSDLATFQSFIISFWALVLNAILVYFAYKAFKHFGVKEQFHSKQFEAVTQLTSQMANTIIKTDFHLMTEDVTLKYDFGFFTLIDLDYFENSTSILIDGDNPEQIFPFLKHSKNPLLPPKIAGILKELNIWSGSGYLSEKSKLGNVLVFKKSRNLNEDILIHYFDMPIEFKKLSKSLKLEITKWLKSYGATDVNF